MIQAEAVSTFVGASAAMFGPDEHHLRARCTPYVERFSACSLQGVESRHCSSLSAAKGLQLRCQTESITRRRWIRWWRQLVIHGVDGQGSWRGRFGSHGVDGLGAGWGRFGCYGIRQNWARRRRGIG